MKLIELSILTVLSVAIVLSGGCGKSGSTATTESFTLNIVDSSGKLIASGHLSLPRDIVSISQFTGAYEIDVTEVPKKPSSQDDYAICCLSQNNGVLSGSIKGGAVRINLHPHVDDANVYLEGELNGQLFKGKCLYQSYAGYKPFGTFEAKRNP
ncbi:MAG: hypothetical protein ACYSUD_18255 [Planctomycetota bacterium]|jgi:hypothetical protein